MRIIMMILTGFAVGFVAGKITGARRGFWKNAIIGIIGSGIGGWLFSLLGIYADSFLGNFLFSVVGACVFTWVLNKLFH